jgi:hypothetical protein
LTAAHPDLIVSIPGRKENRPSHAPALEDPLRRSPVPTRVLLLAALSISSASPAHAALQVTKTYDGSPNEGFFGTTVVVVGDMDGDGRAEFAVGANDDNTAGPGAGRVFIFRGGTGLGGPPAQIIDGLAGDFLGSSLAPAGDQDNDGRADLLIGAPAGSDLTPNATGRVLLVYGSNPLGTRAPRIINGDDPNDRFGESIANLGDFDGDGRTDFAIGAPGRADEQGMVRVYRGGFTPPIPLYSVHGQEIGDAFGEAIAGVGRTRGVASTNDMVVGAPFNSEIHLFAGRAYLFHGGAGADTFPDQVWSGTSDAELGGAVAGIGDINGDGRTDWLVGLPGLQLGMNPAAGRAYLFTGAATPPTGPALLINGSLAFGYLGSALAGIGDVNGDGRPDWAVGQPGSADSPTPGTVRVFLGKPIPTSTPDQVLTGEFEGDDFGGAISNGGRFTTLARDMFFVGAVEFNFQDGRVYQFGDGFPLDAGPVSGPAVAHRLASPWPNPSRGVVRLALELSTNARVKLVVADVAGRVVKTVADGDFTAGRHEFLLSLSNDGAARPGLYWARLVADGQTESSSFVYLGR